MSTVLELDGTTHVVRYGMQDDKKEMCHVYFFRNGKRFIIDVSGDDVRETPFYDTWRPLIEPFDPKTPAGRNWVEQWRNLATLVITASLQQLRELAPEVTYWITLGDYLHTPSYSLQVVKQDGAQNGVATKISKGPEDIPAYEFRPYGVDMFEGLLDGIPKVNCHQLTVLDCEKNWKVPPRKVHIADGQIARFKGYEKPSKSVESGAMHCYSLDSIKCSLRLHETMQRLSPEPIPGLASVLGIVMDERVEDNGSSESSPKQLLAGILISWTGNDTMWDVVRDVDKADTEDILRRSAAWRTKINNVLNRLHAFGLSFCDSNGTSWINDSSTYIDEKDAAWLTTGSSFVSEPRGGEAHNACVEADMKAVRELFEEWLPAELAKKVGT
ncbi:hypothetical protein CLAFUW4_13017 [Fulvia fulva]|uniref:Uncharacterized protein n=1 Tax=Passalora fulva TaxID=5499 RepID=A0A9Q8PJM6_PASFU|nr:uncharacterized protein CLAFUR5_12878 [Fulvia fulva]KAK4612311.1 hypothetical protein CLAFUR4_13021 [Fulvia fulva]UJO23688.1 hypothetical protein CLAFUR5_12878 [Fulvia fulva]WPV21526.1 hypothetical protein CLAFUW4_13017 [Fulvia fulva]WPV36343.1 hypothetical protein CLAFUW7_13024 [Fulvia fulva]